MNEEKSVDSGTPRKPYGKPELKEFGTIAELTATIGNMALADAGIPPNQKSQI
ncbi:MAG: hypothetical protein ACREQZ_01635 [Woeseiaceae bacterium]